MIEGRSVKNEPHILLHASGFLLTLYRIFSGVQYDESSFSQCFCEGGFDFQFTSIIFFPAVLASETKYFLCSVALSILTSPKSQIFGSQGIAVSIMSETVVIVNFQNSSRSGQVQSICSNFPSLTLHLWHMTETFLLILCSLCGVK